MTPERLKEIKELYRDEVAYCVSMEGPMGPKTETIVELIKEVERLQQILKNVDVMLDISTQEAIRALIGVGLMGYTPEKEQK